MSVYRDGALASDAAEAVLEAKRNLLGRVRVASPCAISWNDMDGDDRVRFCHLCEKNVFDVSAMTRIEAEDFVERAQEEAGFACIRFYRRADGTILTSDCPDGSARKRRRLKVIGAAAGALAALAGINAATDGSAAAEVQAAKVNVGIMSVAEPSASSKAVYK